MQPPKFYGLPKIHKTGTPLRPIVSSRGSITYGVAKELSHIIKPLVGQFPHHLKNTQHFIQQLQGKRLELGETITSFDVKALFTSVPVQPSIQIVKQRLQQDNTLPQRTSMSIPQITSLLEFCLSHTYFLFQGKYYEQVQGAAMGSPISPLIANIFIKEFEVQALSSFPHPPSLWLRFVDDTFVINKAEHSQDLLQHINSQDPHIQFTVEPTQQDSLPFLDTPSPFNQTTPSAPQCTGNPPTQINTYTGTAINTSQQNKVSSTPWHIRPKQYLQHRLAWTRN